MTFEWKSAAFNYIRKLTYISPCFAKDIVENLGDYFDDGWSPRDAILEELSYWSD